MALIDRLESDGPKRGFTLSVDGQTFRGTAADAKFPPYEQVIPTAEGREPAGAVGVNLFYMARCAKVNKLMFPDVRTEGMLMQVGPVLDPILLTRTVDNVAVTIVVMPMRV